MARKLEKIDFIKTFVKSAEVMMKNLEITEAEDIKFWKISKTVAELYPALKIAADELNHDYGFKIEIPANTPRDIFDKAEAFCNLHSRLVDETLRSKQYVNATFLFDASHLDFEKKVQNVSNYLNENQNESHCYWMQKSLLLDVAFTGEMKDEQYSKMKDEFLDVQLAEQLVSTLVKRGVTIDASDIEEVREVLADTGEHFAESPGFVSEAEIVEEMIAQFQERCSWDGRNKNVLKTVSEYMEDFTSIVAKNRPDFYKFYANHDIALESLENLEPLISDEYYVEKITHQRFEKTLGINPSELNSEVFKNLDNILVPIDDFADLNEMENDYKLSSIEEYWDDYQACEQLDEDLRGEINRVLAQWVTFVDDDVFEFGKMLTDLQNEYLENDFDDDDEDDNENHKFSFSERNNSQNLEDNVERKSQIISYAKEILDISVAAKKYWDIELNDTPVTKKTLNQINPEEKWDEFTFSSLNMLFRAFDENLDKNQELFLNDDDMELNPDAIDKLIALPSSLEKRNALLLFKFGLAKMEYGYTKNKIDIEVDLVDDFSIFHQDDYAKMVEEMQLGQETFADLNDETLADLVKDINTGVVVNYILPLYNEENDEPQADAFIKVIGELHDYETLSPDTQGFVGKIAERYTEKLLKTHHGLMDKGDIEPELFEWLIEFSNCDDDIKAADLARQKVNVEFEKEDKIYKNYRLFKKNQEENPYSKSVVMDILWQSKFCKN